MGVFDSVSSWFNPTPDQAVAVDPSYTPPDQSAPDVTVTPSAQGFAPSMMLSNSYSLGDMTQTNQQLSMSNMPTTQEQVDNLTIMADVKEQLDNEIGHSTILSGFRTHELQQVLAAKGEPTAAGVSFHELGRAMDLSPVGMTITEFFGRLLANETLKAKFTEIAIKVSQNSIHLAVNVPSDTRDPKVLGLNSDNVYARLTIDDILTYITPYMPNVDAATNYAGTLAAGSSNTMLYVLLAVVLGAVTLMGTKKRT